MKAYADIGTEKDLTPARIKEDLDRFWKEVEEYAKANGGKFAPSRKRDWSRHRFPDDYVLTHADETSMDRLLKSWGWAHPEGIVLLGLGSNAMQAMVEGEELGLDAGGGWGGSEPSTLELWADIDLTNGVDPEKRKRVDRTTIDWATFERQTPDDIRLTKTIPLSPAKTLRDLRTEIRNFALRVRELKASLRP